MTDAGRARPETGRFYRYELYCGGEYQGVGIFHGLGELGFDEGINERLLAPFDEKLRYPHPKERVAFLFTERGNDAFKDDIRPLLDAFASDGLFEARILAISADEIGPDDTVYEDTFQIAVPAGFLDKYRSPERTP